GETLRLSRRMDARRRGNATTPRNQAAEPARKWLRRSNEGRQRVGPLEVGERLRVRDAPQPARQIELPAPAQLEERLEIADRVPEPHPSLVCAGRRQRESDETIVDERRNVEPATRHERVRGSEPCIALDKLQLAIAVVALELDVGDTAQAGVRAKLQPQLGH